MTELSETVLHTIQEKNIKPRPRWFFVVKWLMIWSILAVTFIVGSLASSATIFMLLNADWEVYEQLNRSPLVHALSILPYFWIVLVALSVALVYINLRQTRHGYRYTTLLLVGGSVVTSVVLGGVLYASGVGVYLDRVFARSLPFYNSFVERNQEIWSRPDTGLMAGRVMTMHGPNSFVIRDLNGMEWVVSRDRPDVQGQPLAATGTCLEFIGQSGMDRAFVAHEIRRCHDGFFPDDVFTPDTDD